MCGQGPIGVLLAHPHVQARRPDLAGLQGLQQRRLVHVAAPGDVDDHHAVLHLSQALPVHQGPLPAGGAENQHVRPGVHLVHGDEFHGLALAALRTVKMNGGEDVHPQGLALGPHHLSDAAVAQDAGGLPRQLEALGVGLLLPLVLPHGMPGNGDVPGAGEEEGHGQLRHRVGGGPGGVLHGDARRLGVLHGDVVHTHAGPDDELQAAALGGVDLRLLDLGGGADDDRVEVPQGRSQGVWLIELLYDLVTVVSQLGNCAGVHAVGDQYTL